MKKKHTKFIKPGNISMCHEMLLSMLLKRREIFAVLINFVCFFIDIYIYIYIYIYILYIYAYIYILEI